MRIPKSAYHRQSEPTRDEMGESFRHGPIIKLGRLAMWNAHTRRVVDSRSPALGFMKSADPETFEGMITSARPEFGYSNVLR